MLGRKFLQMLNNWRRVNCLKFNSSKDFNKLNLTLGYHETQRYYWNLKNTPIPIFNIQSYSHLSMNNINKLSDDYGNDNNNENHSDCDKSFSTPNERIQNYENKFIYNILVNSDRYKKTIVPKLISDKNISKSVVNEILAKNYDDFSVTELLEDFKTLSHYAQLNPDNLFDVLHIKLFTLLTRYIPDLLDEQLWDLLKYVALWFPNIFKIIPESFNNLNTAIDDSLCLRIQDFTIDEMFMTCDLLYHTMQIRKAYFVTKVMHKFGMKPKRLSPENFIHFMFLLNVKRHQAFNMYEVEHALESIIDEFNGNELGIITLAFFKNRTPIRNKALVAKIIMKCITDMNNMGDIPICGIMKIIRFCMGLNELPIFRDLLRAFETRLDKLSPSCLIHVGHAASSVLVYEKHILDKIIENFQTQTSNVRLKDLERMLFILSIFNYPPDTPCYELIIKELRNPDREVEFMRFYKCLPYSLMYLANVGIYPLDIIEKIMDVDYIRNVYRYDTMKMGLEYLFINNSLQIEVPEYKGPTLSPKILKYLNKKFSPEKLDSKTKDNRPQSAQIFLEEVADCLKNITGPNNLMITQLLTHFQRPDIVVGIDSNNNFVSLKEFMSDTLIGSIKYAPTFPEGHKWICFITASHNQIYRDETTLSGTLNVKIRQIRKIGYVPIVLLHPLWKNHQTSSEKKKYIQEKLLENNITNIIK